MKSMCSLLWLEKHTWTSFWNLFYVVFLDGDKPFLLFWRLDQMDNSQTNDEINRKITVLIRGMWYMICASTKNREHRSLNSDFIISSWLVEASSQAVLVPPRKQQCQWHTKKDDNTLSWNLLRCKILFLLVIITCRNLNYDLTRFLTKNYLFVYNMSLWA